MNSLPSPPLRTLPHDLASRHSYHRSHHSDPTMDALLAAVWNSIQQSPPPTLRDILDAYRTKGDGDRDMLIAMLNAKSAEDQRISSLASLQRTMLELYQPPLHAPAHSIPPLHLTTDVALPHYPHHHSHSSSSAYASATHMPSPPHTSYHHSPHPRVQSQDEPMHHSSHRRSDSSASTSKDSLRVPSTSPSRKRRRSSRSPEPSRDRHRAHLEPGAAHDLPLPPSPYSSASSHSSSGSPRSRESMAIGALLASSQGRSEESMKHVSTSSERHSSAPTRDTLS